MKYRNTIIFLSLLCASVFVETNARAQDSATDTPAASTAASPAPTDITSPGEDAARRNTNAARENVSRLASRVALERQRAAEELARLAVPEQQTIVNGYRAQERDRRVRLALDWAVYRMGRADALSNVVRELDTQRVNQAYAYLIALESPEPLYPFLDRANAAQQIKLLEILARIGNAATLEKIQPLAASYNLEVARAAGFAKQEIERRLTRTPAAQTTATRPRQVGDTTDVTAP